MQKEEILDEILYQLEIGNIDYYEAKVQILNLFNKKRHISIVGNSPLIKKLRENQDKKNG